MKYWKVIFWILAIFTFFDFIGLPSAEGVDPIELTLLAVSTMLLIPYYGYAYQLVIGWKKLWIAAFVLTLPISLYQMWLVVELAVYYLSENGSVISFSIMFITLAFSILLLIPPYLYAFKSNKLWEENA